MFIKVDLNGATNILISIPSEGSEKTLPAIINMLEQNAVFIEDSWNKFEETKPNCSIVLGDRYSSKRRNEDADYTVAPSNCVIDGFEPVNNQLFISFNEYKEKAVEEHRKLTKELNELKEKNKSLIEKIEVLAGLNGSIIKDDY